MKTSKTLDLVLCAALLFSLKSLSQTPAQPGVLRIDSDPDTANITLNGKLLNQKTPASLVVSPGTYTVSVSGKSGSPNCPGKPFQVSSGETVEHYCSGTTWSTKSE
jgi:hypothetical protein